MTIATTHLVDLVITAPEPFAASLSYRTRCRTTIGVLTQIVIESRSHVIIGAPFMQSGFGLSSGPIADALRSALRRGVNVEVLGTGVGLQTLHGANLAENARGALKLFQPSSNLENEQQLGSHAKFFIADGEVAYVGSANLTYRGLSDQVELGIMIRGSVAQQIEHFWQYSIDIGLFVPYPNLER